VGLAGGRRNDISDSWYALRDEEEAKAGLMAKKRAGGRKISKQEVFIDT